MNLVRDLFESNLTVTDLQRSMDFFGQTLGLELAKVFWDQRAAFYWMGGRQLDVRFVGGRNGSPKAWPSRCLFARTSRICTPLSILEQRMEFHSTLGGTRPTNRLCLDGCQQRLSISVTQTGICSSSSRCCRITRNQNWELSVGVAGTKFVNPVKGRCNNRRGTPWHRCTSCSVASTPQPTKFERLHQQRDHAGDHECYSPHQVEIEPGLAQDREAKLAVDHPRDESGDRKISRRVDRGGK